LRCSRYVHRGTMLLLRHVGNQAEEHEDSTSAALRQEKHRSVELERQLASAQEGARPGGSARSGSASRRGSSAANFAPEKVRCALLPGSPSLCPHTPPPFSSLLVLPPPPWVRVRAAMSCHRFANNGNKISACRCSSWLTASTAQRRRWRLCKSRSNARWP
jgi:hypothetical protein